MNSSYREGPVTSELTMIDVPESTHSWDGYTARATVLQGLSTDALSQAFNDPMRPDEQMHPCGQGSPDDRVSSYGQPSSHDQVSPQEYISPISTSYMTPGSQFYDDPSHTDRPTHPMSVPYNGITSSHLATPESTACAVAPRQPHDSYLTSNSQTPSRSQYPEANSPLTLAPYLAFPRFPERDSSGHQPVLRQPLIGEDQYFLHATNARASIMAEELTGVARQNMNADGTFDGSMSTASLDQDSTMLDAEGEDECESEQQRDEYQERATIPAYEHEVKMVDKYAFNFVREAYNHCIPQELTTGITIHVGSLAPITTSLKQHREEMANKTPEVQEDVVPLQVPHPNEYQKGLRTIECVWIGMLPSPAALLRITSKIDQPTVDAAGEGSSKNPAKKRSRKDAAVAGLKEAEMQTIDFDQNALRVVAKKSDKATRDTHIYALLNPDSVSNLCHGFKVSFDDVFYFREFRDDTTKSIMPRKKSTITKIRASVFPMETPVLTNGELSSCARATRASTCSLPDEFVTRHAPVASQSPRSSAKDLTENTRSSSKITLHKNKKKGENITSRKRKAQHNNPGVSMKQRDENRKKARAEEYRIHPSDSEPQEGVEKDDRDTPADRVDDIEKGSMNLASDSFEDVDGPGEPASSTAEEAHLEDGPEGSVDDEAFPHHAVGAEDPRFLRYTDDLVRSLSRGADPKLNGPKTVSPQGMDVQLIDKNGKAATFVNSNRRDCGRDGGDDWGQDAHTGQQESANLAQNIKDLANEFVTSQDVVGLQQALTMMRCVQKRCAPLKTSILGLYLNVPKSNDISTEECATKLKQLRALFKGHGYDKDIQDHVLAWMIKGLQMTGQSLSIDILYPCLIAFSKQYKSKFGDSLNKRISRDVLVDMTCCARTTAEEMLSIEALVNGTDRATLEAEGECPSHPYVDPNEKYVYQPAVWNQPEEKARSSG